MRRAKGRESATVRVSLQDSRAIPWWKRVPSPGRLLIFCTVVFLFAVGTMVAGFAALEVVRETGASDPTGIIEEGFRWVEEPGSYAFRDRERMNILCLGIDYNYTEKGILYTKGARSDTIFVVSLDARGDTLNVLSIPRDTQVFISEQYGYDKINAAYALGGIELALETISEFLKVPLDHYVIVKAHAARKIVDALGGVAVDVEKDMDYDDEWGRLHIHLKKGPQLLNGEQLVGYCRFRNDEEGDRGRIRRQQQVMRALLRRLREPTVILKLDKIARIIKESVETDLKIPELIDLARLYKDFDRSRMLTGVIVGDDADIDGISYIIPYEAENERIVRELLLDPRHMTLADIRVEVLNGSGVEGAAGKLAERLRQEGFRIVRVANAETEQAFTRVIQRVDNPIVSSAAARMVPGVYVEREIAQESPLADITIVVGRDRAPGGRELTGPSYPVDSPQPDPAPEEPALEVPETREEEVPVELKVRESPEEWEPPAPLPPSPAAEGPLPEGEASNPLPEEPPDLLPPPVEPTPLAPAPIPTPAVPIPTPEAPAGLNQVPLQHGAVLEDVRFVNAFARQFDLDDWLG